MLIFFLVAYLGGGGGGGGGGRGGGGGLFPHVRACICIAHKCSQTNVNVRAYCNIAVVCSVTLC